MDKILLAVGHRQLEEYIEEHLKREYSVVGNAIYREAIIRTMAQTKPDIVVIRETLEGKENIMSIVYEIRSRFPKTRIIFIAGQREPGDELLATLVNYGVYDILSGSTIQGNKIIGAIRNPNEYKDVKHLQPAPSLDEETNKMIFNAPNMERTETVREIYVEGEGDKGSSEVINTDKTTETLENLKNLLPEGENITDAKTIPSEEKKGFFSKISEITESIIPEKTEEFVGKKSNIKGKGESVGNAEVKKPIINNYKNLDMGNFQNAKGQIVTFLGGRSGVGTSSVALNTAVILAKRGLNVIYIELNEVMPYVSYLYDLNQIEYGIDTSLKSLKSGAFDDVKKSIITSKELKNRDTDYVKNYKKFPNSLDFMFYSQEYISSQRIAKDMDLSLTKELYLYLLFQLNYDFVILDVPFDTTNIETINALIYSNKVYTIVTQDVSSVGYYLSNIHELDKKGINFEKKNHYILNRFEKSDFNVKELESWIDTTGIMTIPDCSKDFINANFIGLPMVLYSKNREYISSINQIENSIFK